MPEQSTIRRPRLRSFATLALLLPAVGSAALAGCSSQQNDTTDSQATAVNYTVGGTGSSASITYSGENGPAQATAAQLPWTMNVPVDGRGKTVTLGATNGPNSGTIGCTITVGGKVLASKTATGPFATASCSADLRQ